MLSEVSQTEKDNILYDIMYMQNLKNTTKKKQTHEQREQTSGYQWQDGSNMVGKSEAQTIGYKIVSRMYYTAQGMQLMESNFQKLYFKKFFKFFK